MKCKKNKLFKKNLKKNYKTLKRKQKYSLFLPISIEESPNFSLVDNATIFEENKFTNIIQNNRINKKKFRG